MDNQKRLLIFAACALPLYLGMMYYMQQKQKARQAQIAAAAPAEADAAAATPGAVTAEGTAAPQSIEPVKQGEPGAPAPVPVEATGRSGMQTPVHVQTETYALDFSPEGAVPVRWDIIDTRYALASHDAATSGTHRAVQLIDPALESTLHDRPFEIILRELNARFYKQLNEQVYTVVQRDEATQKVVEFTSPKTDNGVQMVKTYRFPNKGFESTLEIKLINGGGQNLTFNNSAQGLGVTLGPGLGKPPEGHNNQDYTHPFFKTDTGVKEQKLDKDGLPTDPVQADWVGMHNRYFAMTVAPVAGAVPAAKSTARAKIDTSAADPAIASAKEVIFYPRIELHNAPFTIQPGQSQTFTYRIFAGPKEREILKQSKEGLDQLLFMGSYPWMRAICLFLMAMLSFFHGILGNWGLAILALVITVRLATFPLAHIGMKHQATMMLQQSKLKPHLDRINEKHKDDPSKKNQEVMKLYQEHGVNPFGAFKGCIWMIIQLPIFFALYRILAQDIHLRGAGFLWIDDLSQPDRLFSLGFTLPILGSNYFNLLPFLTTATQVVISKLSMKSNPAMGDNPMQKQMMYMMPVMVLFITYGFASGLVFYWLVSNIWQLLQQEFVNKKIMGPAREAAEQRG